MRNTYFLDIDGTLLEHIEDWENIYRYKTLRALPGAKERTSKWHCEGHMVVLTTARPESLRDITVEQLKNAGVFYDILLMGLGAGTRILVNDVQTPMHCKAIAHNVLRNVEGIQHID